MLCLVFLVLQSNNGQVPEVFDNRLQNLKKKKFLNKTVQTCHIQPRQNTLNFNLENVREYSLFYLKRILREPIQNIVQNKTLSQRFKTLGFSKSLKKQVMTSHF